MQKFLIKFSSSIRLGFWGKVWKNREQAHTWEHMSRQANVWSVDKKMAKECWNVICGGSDECTFYWMLSVLIYPNNLIRWGLVHRLTAVAASDTDKWAQKTHKIIFMDQKLNETNKKNPGSAWCRSAYLNCTSAQRKVHALNFHKIINCSGSKRPTHTAPTMHSSGRRIVFILKILCWSSK